MDNKGPDITPPKGASADAEQEPDLPVQEDTKEVFTIDEGTTKQTWAQMDAGLVPVGPAYRI